MPARPLALAFVLAAAACAAASAETLCCRSVSGNTTCSGHGAVSCQTVNGRTVCVGGHGAAVQSFGGGTLTPEEMQELGTPDRGSSPNALGREGELDDEAPPRRAQPRLSIDRQDANGTVLSLERSEGRLRLRTRRAAVAIDRWPVASSRERPRAPTSSSVDQFTASRSSPGHLAAHQADEARLTRSIP